MCADSADGKPPVVFLMGTTASGKTELASALFSRFPVELVSVDAAQVYRGMDIGTGKPSREFLERFPHHLIDIREPAETYSAAEFVSDAGCLIEEIGNRGNVPLLVGGTMFYFHALEFGLSPLPSADPSIRNDLMDELDQLGFSELHRKLQSVDPITASRIKSNDVQRLIRALEIFHITGKPPEESMSLPRGLTRSPVKLVLFSSLRENLHQKIRSRFLEMVESGLVDEVASVAGSLENPDTSSALRTVGYRQVWEMLQGRTTKNEMIERAVAATRQFAKRQLTWLRQQRGLVWVQTDGVDHPIDLVTDYLRSNSEFEFESV